MILTIRFPLNKILITNVFRKVIMLFLKIYGGGLRYLYPKMCLKLVGKIFPKKSIISVFSNVITFMSIGVITPFVDVIYKPIIS